MWVRRFWIHRAKIFIVGVCLSKCHQPPRYCYSILDNLSRITVPSLCIAAPWDATHPPQATTQWWKYTELSCLEDLLVGIRMVSDCCEWIVGTESSKVWQDTLHYITVLVYILCFMTPFRGISESPSLRRHPILFLLLIMYVCPPTLLTQDDLHFFTSPRNNSGGFIVAQ